MTDLRKLRWWLIIAILACAGLYLIGNGQVPLWDRDEGWYAQCSKEMWETGDWVVPKFLGGLRAEKPVFVYWLQLGGYWLFGGPSEFAVRFYAAVAQVLVLCILGWGLWKLAGPLRGTWAAVIYGTCIMAIISAKMCLTDATLMVCLMSAQLILMYFYLNGVRWWGIVLMGIALGFGGLTKGPVALVPTIFTIIALAVIDYDRWLPCVRPSETRFWKSVGRWSLIALAVLAITLAVCAPWLIILELREPRWLPATLNMAGQHIGKSLEGHKGPFGYYLALMWGTFFPWSLLVPTAVYVAWKQRHVPQTRFAIAATLGPWIFFEIMRTKLPHYVLPTYPFLAFLCADALVRCTRGQYIELTRRFSVVAVGIWAFLIGWLASAPWIAAYPPLKLANLPYARMAVVSVLGFVFTFGVFWYFRQRRFYRSFAWMAGAFIVLIGVTYGWMLPQFRFMQYSTELATILAKYDGLADKAPVGDVVSLVYPIGDEAYGFREPSAHYYQGGTLRVIEKNRFLEITPPEQWPRLMIISDTVLNVLPDSTKAQLESLGTVRGWLYSDERRIGELMVMRRKAVAATQPVQ